MTNKSDGSVTYHQVDNNFTDRVVSFTKEIQDEPLMCIELIVSISAISNYSFINTSQQPHKVFNVTDNILPLRK